MRITACVGFLVVTFLIVGIASGYATDNRTEHPTNGAIALATIFCNTIRPDILPLQKGGWITTTSTTNSIVHFPIGDGREAVILVDSIQNEITYFSVIKYLSHKHYLGRTNLSRLEIVDRAKKTLRKLGISTNVLIQVSSSCFSFSPNNKQRMFEFFWQRQVQGFCFKTDYVNLIFDAQDGELLSFKKVWGPQPGSLHMKITLDAAKEIAMRHLLGSGTGTKLDVKSADVCVVSPNSFLNIVQTNSEIRKLAWALQLPKQSRIDKPMEIWVDTETGGLLGGLALN
jgi:hypothetical protein